MSRAQERSGIPLVSSAHACVGGTWAQIGNSATRPTQRSRAAGSSRWRGRPRRGRGPRRPRRAGAATNTGVAATGPRDGDERRDHVRDRRGVRRHDERHVDALCERSHRRSRAVGAGDQVADDRQEPPPGRPEPEGAPVANEQLDAELGLERPHLARDGGLGDRTCRAAAVTEP